MLLLLGAYAALVLALLLAELQGKRALQTLVKPLAAIGFLILALKFGALESIYGRYVFAGLTACAIGDVCLLSRKSKTIFRLGMLAFAFGHISYILAAGHIIRPDLSLLTFTFTTVLGLGFGFTVFLSLKKDLPKDMVWPVGVYTFIISLMLVRAFQTDMVGLHLFMVVGAILFAISDVFVARDRFVAPSPKNAWVITPLYFGAQALFALSVIPS